VYELPTTVLVPGKQIWVDVGKLIRDQVPDRKGQLLPPGVMGSYEIKDLKNHQVGYLYEGKVITDKTFGHATYGCALCCEYGGVGYDGFYLTPNPLYGTPGGGGQYNATALNQCTGVDDPVDTYAYSSSNTSVATATAVGHTSFVGPGSATMTAFAKLQSTQNPSCRPQPYQAQAPTTVQVPTSLKVVNATILQTGKGGCKAGYYGIEIDITYQVLDQNSAALQSASMIPKEYVVWYDGTNNGGFTNIVPPPGTTRSDGTWDDTPVGICKAVPFNTPLTSTQKIHINLNGQVYSVRTNNWKFSSTNLTNHGTITNGGDVNETQ
jgi:hypothetical protein